MPPDQVLRSASVIAEQMSTGRFATSSALCKRKSQVLELDSFFFDFRSESMTAVFYVVDNVLEIRVKELDQFQDAQLKVVVLICVA